MESSVRHDLRHPIATIAMIASTVVEYGDSLDHETLRDYAAQVNVELSSLQHLMGRHSFAMETADLEHAAQKLMTDHGSASAALDVELECKRLIDQLSKA